MFRDKHLYWVIPAAFAIGSFVPFDLELWLAILSGRRLDPYSYLIEALYLHSGIAFAIALASATIAWRFKRPRHAFAILAIVFLLALAWERGLQIVGVVPDG